MRARWTSDEMAILLRDYPNHGADHVARQVGRSLKAVESQAARLRRRGADAYRHRDREFYARQSEGRRERSTFAVDVLRERIAEGLPATCASVRDIAASYGFSMQEITSRKRLADLVACRAEIVAFLRRKGLAFAEIGHRLGDRCHPDAIHLFAIWRRAAATVEALGKGEGNGE